MPVIGKGAGFRPSPVRGDPVAQAQTPVTGKQLAALDKLKEVDGGKVDQYLDQAAQMLQQGILRGPQSAASAPLRAPDAGSTDKVSGASAKIQELLPDALTGLGKLFQDGFVREGELSLLSQVQSKLSAALELENSPVLQMMPHDVVQSFEQNLFAPMRDLLQAAGSQNSALFGEVAGRDQAALTEKLGQLDAPGGARRLTAGGQLRQDLFKPLDASTLDARPEDRAQIGDLVAVGRSGGKSDMGVIVGKDDDGFRVEVLTGTGELGLKKVGFEDYAFRNPLRLGDTFEFKGQQVFVHGLGQDGRVRARGFQADGQAGVELNGGELALAVDALKAQGTRASDAVVDAVAVHPGKTSAAQDASVVAAGGAEQLTPAVVEGKTAKGGLYTCKGPNEAEHGMKYKDYNEDAAVLGVASGGPGRKETFYAGAFDQAGGMGHSSATGAASQAAALAFEQASQRIAAGGDPMQELLAGHQASVDEVGVLNEGMARPMMTTVAAGVVKDHKAHVITCGDAQAMLYSKDGKLKQRTTPHNSHEEMFQKTGEVNGIGLKWANGITRAVGGDDPAFQRADTYSWDVEPGDFLLFLSDGVTDANLQAQKNAAKSDHPFTQMNGAVTEVELGDVLRQSDGAEQATAAVGRYAMDQVVAGKGKPDNTTAVVVQVS